MLAPFGARVTAVQAGEQLLSSTDPDISAVIQTAFTDEATTLRPSPQLRRAAPAVVAASGSAVLRAGAAPSGPRSPF